MKIKLATDLLIKANLNFHQAQLVKNHFTKVLREVGHVYVTGLPGKLEVRYKPKCLIELKEQKGLLLELEIPDD